MCAEYDLRLKLCTYLMSTILRAGNATSFITACPLAENYEQKLGETYGVIQFEINSSQDKTQPVLCFTHIYAS